MFLNFVTSLLALVLVSSCGEVPCWETRFAEAARRYGLNAAFGQFERLREDDALFRANCHTVAHAIGEAAYERFVREPVLTAHPAMASCGYGFFHGFMQEHVSHGRSGARAQEICDSMPVGSRDQCYHGIGHGIVYASIADAGLREVPLASLAISQCNGLFDDAYECINGVFGGIALLYFGVHGFSIEPKLDDPLWLCRTLDSEYQKRCYDQMVPVAYELSGDDFKKTGIMLSGLEDAEIARTAIEHLAFMPVHTTPIRSAGDALRLGETVFQDCRDIGEYVDSCTGGFAKSIVFSQLAPQGAAWARAVCETYLTGSERASCLSMVGRQIEYSYEETE